MSHYPGPFNHRDAQLRARASQLEHELAVNQHRHELPKRKRRSILRRLLRLLRGGGD